MRDAKLGIEEDVTCGANDEVKRGVNMVEK